MELLEFIVLKLCAVVTDSNNNMSFEQAFVDSCGPDGNSAAWMQPANKGGRQISSARSALAASATLLRVLSCHHIGSDCTAVGDEHVEKALALCAEFVKKNGKAGGGDSRRGRGFFRQSQGFCCCCEKSSRRFWQR